MVLIPRRAAIYARVSSHRQQKLATIDSQLQELRTRVGQDGHQLLEEHILVDDGHSGSYLDRPGLDRLRDLARDGALEVVYLQAPDRLARRYVHQVILIEELEGCGCEVVFLNYAPSDDPEGQLLVQIQGVIAEYERAKINERMRRGKLHRARQGVVLSWKAPYGYRYVPRQGQEPGRWEINEAEVPMIRALFGWVRDEGLSIRQATKRLNASPFKPRSGREVWSPSSVRAILTNEAYTGISYYNRHRFVKSDRTDRTFRKNRKTKCVLRPREEWIPVAIPALIDKQSFARVQKQLQKNKAFARRNLRREGEYLLRCLVSCGVCGRTMVAHAYGRHTYYHCAGNVDPISAGKPRRCPAPLVFAPDLDRLVWAEIESLLRSPRLMKKAWKQQRANHGLRAPDVVEVELERVNLRIRDASRQIQRLVDGYQAGLVGPGELGKRRAGLEERIAYWTTERNDLEAERPKWREAQAVSENLSRFCEHVAAGLGRLNFEEKQKLLRKLIERIWITAWEVKVKLTIPLSTNLDLTSLRVDHPQTPARLLPLRPHAQWGSGRLRLARAQALGARVLR
jgi:site-specific DNA recombinase